MLVKYNHNMITYDEIIDGWRNKVKELTQLGAVIMLKYLGGFEKDEVLIHCRGIYTVKVHDLWQYHRNTERCVDIYPVYFIGGPTGEVRFRGTLLTLVIDRMLATCIEKGDAYVNKVIAYVKGHYYTTTGVS